jgi:hypothetical protein
LIWKRWSHNLGAKLLALICAVALWLTVTNGIEFETTLVFPIEYVNRPEGLTSLEALPRQVSARVTGKGKFLRYTTRKGFCRVDLAGTQIGTNTLILNWSNITIPQDAGVSRVEVQNPRRIVVEFDETIVRDIPITPTIEGSPDPRYVQVGKTFLNPPVARVKGPRRLVDEIALVATQPIDIRGHRSTVRKTARLVPSAHPTVEYTPESVEIGITIELVVEEKIEGLQLDFGGTIPDGCVAHARPSDLRVGIRGARSIVEVATREVASVALVATEWEEGATILRFLEVRGRDLVFAPDTTIPPMIGPSDAKRSGDEPLPHGPLPPVTGKVPAAVRGEVVARLPLPRGVDVLGVEPERFAVVIRRESEATNGSSRSASAGS